MANLTITEFKPVYDRPYEQYSLPAGEALAVGDVARLDASTGKATGANATSPTEANAFGIVVKAAAANYTTLVFKRGLAYMDGLASLDYGALLWLSTTDKKISDADPGVNELQTLTITGSPTGGTFTLTFEGQTTGNIAYNATAAAVQAALEALPSIGTGNVICGGGALPGTAVTIRFVNDLGKKNVALITGNFSGLTGGTSPTGSIVETTAGVHSVLIGRVVPIWDNVTAPTKGVSVEL